MNIESSLATRLVLLITLIVLTPTALAANIIGKESIGKTIIAKGQVYLVGVDSKKTNRLRRRAPIYQGDVITTLDDSKAQLRMTDRTMIALKAHSELHIERHDEHSGVISMTLTKGSLRTVPGSIDTIYGNYQLKTPVGKVISTSGHYEVDIINEDVYLSVWTGTLDFAITVGDTGDNVRLGEGQGHSHAKIDAKGQLTLLNKGR
ncbi:MAG: FecR domain-containing protein [Algicola sp.]|nr:FecR domain-containing protein [Algicola sp.]